jgi:GMP synthase (glutamine-hydrolysing)
MAQELYEDKILILDFGSQYTNLIARRVRELNTYCEIHPFDISDTQITTFNPRGIILSGSPESVERNITYRAPQIVFQMGIPVLGICYGMQTMAKQLGGEITSMVHREFGHAQVQYTQDSLLLRDLNETNRLLDVWMSHGDQISILPPGFQVTGSSTNCKIAAIEDQKRHLYALQFHPEVTHTKHGTTILRRFVHDICQCKALWQRKNIIQHSIEAIRAQVGRDEVILGLSGGVDSAVVAALLHQAIGQQLTCIFVDTGLLRHNESQQVFDLFTRRGFKVKLVNAQDRFLNALQGVYDPEVKRKIIGKAFIDIFEEMTPEGTKWLAQGTIYSDVIESAASRTGKAHVIKSHHNVGGLPEKMNLKLLEPLRELFKDEVRAIGLELGLPADMIHRHPFPGPGLGVRILGEITKEYINILQKADAIFIDELKRHQLYDRVSQAFAVFLPVKSVGVMGDGRKYDWVIALRAVETTDFMTARWAHLPHDILSHISQRIINEIHGISRVVYDISDKPPATIEWE